jgi:hypothetical protein
MKLQEMMDSVALPINENWDTDEMYNWVANDEGLYNAAMNASSGDELKLILDEFGFDFRKYDVNPDKVDWDEVLLDVQT